MLDLPEGVTVMDITSEKHKGKELVAMINHEFNSTQKVLVRPYPSILTMTMDQYKELEALALTYKQELYGDYGDRMFKTDKGFIMEVRING